MIEMEQSFNLQYELQFLTERLKQLQKEMYNISSRIETVKCLLARQIEEEENGLRSGPGRV